MSETSSTPVVCEDLRQRIVQLKDLLLLREKEYKAILANSEAKGIEDKQTTKQLIDNLYGRIKEQENELLLEKSDSKEALKVILNEKAKVIAERDNLEREILKLKAVIEKLSSRFKLLSWFWYPEDKG